MRQAERDTLGFHHSPDEQAVINDTMLRLFGQSVPLAVDWAWAHQILEKKQLPEIRKRLIDILGRDRPPIPLGLEEQRGWVSRSTWEARPGSQVQGEDQKPLTPPRLIDIFGRPDVAGKLLILGIPGAGKTTMLLTLAEQLVRGALANPKTVIPVLFELSTWRQDDQTIQDWLVEQLCNQHSSSQKARLYRKWLDQQVLLPLMDGLDELEVERQQPCALRLKEFARYYPQLVVCCQVRSLAHINIRFNTLNGAVCLAPLSDHQIQTYFNTQQSSFWSVIQANSPLQALLEPTSKGGPGLLRIPLFATLIANAYHPHQPFQTKTDLLDLYIERQLSLQVRQHDRQHATEKQDWAYKTLEREIDWRRTKRTLSWLARQLQQNNLIEIQVEQIQPSWLETQRIQRQYRLMVGLVVGLMVGLMGGLLFGVIAGLLFGLRDGVIVGLIDGLASGLVGGLIAGLVMGVNDIEPVEIFNVSISGDVQREWLRILQRWLTMGLAGGLIGGLIGGSMVGLSAGLMDGLTVGLATGVTGGLAGGLFLWLKQDLQLRSHPNQGIWNSLQNMVWTTILIYTPGIMLTFGIAGLASMGMQRINEGEASQATIMSLWEISPQFPLPSLFGALLFGFWIGGGLVCVQHLCLRIVLWQRGIAPWNVTRFLNYCVERRLLQRVGNRYRFLHQELLDHFAQLSP